MVHTDQAKFILLSDLGPLSLPAEHLLNTWSTFSTRSTCKRQFPSERPNHPDNVRIPLYSVYPEFLLLF